jgi:serine/threonine protein kinase
MLHDDVIKIVDFGLSKGSKRNIYLTSLGTPFTMAPEVLSKKPYTNKADIWSLGTILYMMLEVRFPFHPRTNENILSCILNQ